MYNTISQFFSDTTKKIEKILHIQTKLSRINDKYTICRNRLILKSSYRNDKETLHNLAKKYDNAKIIVMEVQTYADIDAHIKLVLDSLEGKCFENDKNIEYLLIKKIKGKRGHDEVLKVWVN